MYLACQKDKPIKLKITTEGLLINKVTAKKVTHCHMATERRELDEGKMKLVQRCVEQQHADQKIAKDLIWMQKSMEDAPNEAHTLCRENAIEECMKDC